MTKTKDGYKDTMKNLCFANFLSKKCRKMHRPKAMQFFDDGWLSYSIRLFRLVGFQFESDLIFAVEITRDSFTFAISIALTDGSLSDDLFILDSQQGGVSVGVLFTSRRYSAEHSSAISSAKALSARKR